MISLMQRSQNVTINFLRIPNSAPLIRRFSVNAICLNEKKKSHKPKTLEQSMEEAKIKDSTDSNNDPSLPKHLPREVMNRLTNMGPNVPEKWRKMTNLPEWKRQKYSLLEKFNGAKWDPKKRITREQMDSVRMLKKSMPDMSSQELSKHFEISPEAIRRILKSKWKPSGEEEDRMQEQWKKRGVRVKKLLKERSDVTMGTSEILDHPKVLLGSKDEFQQVNFFKDGNLRLNKKKIKQTKVKERLYNFDRSSIGKTEF